MQKELKNRKNVGVRVGEICVFIYTGVLGKSPDWESTILIPTKTTVSFEQATLLDLRFSISKKGRLATRFPKTFPYLTFAERAAVSVPSRRRLHHLKRNQNIFHPFSPGNSWSRHWMAERDHDGALSAAVQPFAAKAAATSQATSCRCLINNRAVIIFTQSGRQLCCRLAVKLKGANKYGQRSSPSSPHPGGIQAH